MNNEKKGKIDKLKKAYAKFEKTMNELKSEQDQIIKNVIKEMEKKQIKETMKKLEEIED